ncbi:hypothetical protein [Limimaricola cinnabarinus]|uniref:hypothetical protein n=1 Tax=Limimaricola cinnabarinus TaxID=1125964 RepID=UPI0024929972|nr:hypothetical protein [Limimaricola cinnabarinus]
MKRLFEVRSPFFVPVWRRVVVVVLVFGWALIELSQGAPGWALLFAAAGAWCAWQFFFVFDQRPGGPNDPNGSG